MENIKINKDEYGHYGQLFANRNGRNLCVCPICFPTYAKCFCKGETFDEGFATKEEAIDFWNKNHPSEV